MERTAGRSSGAALARLRIEAGYSVRRLAEAASLWPTSVSRAERGEFVSAKVRESLVAVLGEQARPLIAVRTRSPEPDTAVYRRRMALGLSGREAARLADVPKDTYNRAERGQAIHWPTAHKIAAAFGLSVFDVRAHPGCDDDDGERAA